MADKVRANVLVCVCVCVCVCACVCEIEWMCGCVCECEREQASWREKERERERVCVCVRESISDHPITHVATSDISHVSFRKAHHVRHTWIRLEWIRLV